MTPPVAAEELRRGVEAAAAGTPYVVAPTERGFDVSLDLVDAQWFGLFNAAGLRKQYTHHVAVRGDGTYTVTDDSREVEWVAGVPRVAAGASRQIGRFKELGVQKVWAFDERGRFGPVVDFRFSSEEGRDLVTGVADQLGLRLRRGTAEIIGLVFALVAVVGLVVGGAAVGVLALLGRL
ncbi:hypothetical protein KDN32_19990 [Nocardioides sp. J2M5]|uniref:hypothetical protein n=1 Tax=Nocardioides palaemonis TaxID=2829810 RepID=UPI001BAB2736|nr:hypothetical protein [Nocardioides palaemonis]MBS2940024.1 hypothetical protein [Nocardioides palaemonis]